MMASRACTRKERSLNHLNLLNALGVFGDSGNEARHLSDFLQEGVDFVGHAGAPYEQCSARVLCVGDI
jgi:hypothetical protein